MYVRLVVSVALTLLAVIAAAPAAASTISAGVRHTCAVTSSGAVNCWGNNISGEVGPNAGTRSTTPVAVPPLADATAVAAGSSFTCAAQRSGGVSCWGDDSQGQLGNGAGGSSSTPGAVSGLSDAVTVAAGDRHVCALRSGGSVVCWGDDTNGALGTGAIGSDAQTPQPVAGVTDAIGLAAHGTTTCAVRGSGAVVCWGDGDDGQLGNGTSGAGLSSPSAVAVQGLTDATSVAVGTSHACALRRSGTVICWGTGLLGQLGTAATSSFTPTTEVNLADVATIAAGGSTTCATTVSGTTHCWGSGRRGLLGDLVRQSSSDPVAISMPSATALALGSVHACALIGASEVRCWGTAADGRTGIGASTFAFAPVLATGASQVVQVAAGEEHTCALRSDGRVLCAGEGNQGQTLGAIREELSEFTLVPGITDAVEITAGAEHTCVLRAGGSVSCWGETHFGQAGAPGGPDDIVTAPVTVSRFVGLGPVPLTSLVQVDAGARSTCAVDTGGVAWCWGNDTFGQLGDGPTDSSGHLAVQVTPSAQFTEVSVGDLYACAITTTGQVRCWGNDASGQLGDGSSALGTTEPTAALAGLSGVQSLTAGGGHACAVRGDGELRCWGRSADGQMGNGTASNTVQATPVAVADPLAIVTSARGAIRDVVAGDRHTCVRRAASVVACWGSNASGQGGVGSTATAITTISEIDTLPGGALARGLALGEDHTCAAHVDGGVSCWGGGDDGQLADGPIPGGHFGAQPVAAAVAIAGGARSTSAPTLSAAPTITGAALVGSTLTCAAATWAGRAPITTSLQWLRDGQPIAGATAASFTSGAGDVGRSLTCRETATNGLGRRTATSAPLVPTAAPAPTPLVLPPTLRLIAPASSRRSALSAGVTFRVADARPGTRVRLTLKVGKTVLVRASAKAKADGTARLRVRLGRTALRRAKVGARITVELRGTNRAGVEQKLTARVRVRR